MTDWSQVHARLKEWAEWFSANPFGLGYPTQSREYHLWKGAGILNKNAPNIFTHARAEEIETLVNQLKAFSQPIAHVLQEHYFYPNAISEHARKLKLSSTTYKHYLEIARAWIAGGLSSKKSL